MQGKLAKNIRRFCLDCQGGSSIAVTGCADTPCFLHALRLCTTTPLAPEIRPLRLIRQYCLVCAGSKQAVRECIAKEDCLLWSYRFGVQPTTFKRVVARQRKNKTTLLLLTPPPSS